MISMNRFQAILSTSPKSTRNFAAGALAVALGLSIGAGNTQATTYLWAKPAGGIWSDSTSWSPNGVRGHPTPPA